MWALDGILIGAEDYRYLAITCTLTAIIYIPALLGINALDGNVFANDTTRMVALWAVLNIVFVGMRAVFNGLRARTDHWMKIDALSIVSPRSGE